MLEGADVIGGQILEGGHMLCGQMLEGTDVRGGQILEGGHMLCEQMLDGTDVRGGQILEGEHILERGGILEELPIKGNANFVKR